MCDITRPGADQAHPAGAYRAGLPSLPSTRIASRSCQSPSHACTSRTQSSGLRLAGPRGPSGGHARNGRAALTRPTDSRRHSRCAGMSRSDLRVALEVNGWRPETGRHGTASAFGQAGVRQRVQPAPRRYLGRCEWIRKRHRHSRARDSEHGSPSWSPSARLASRPWHALDRPRDSPSRTIPRGNLVVTGSDAEVHLGCAADQQAPNLNAVVAQLCACVE